VGLLNDWPPSAERYYLSLDLARPLFQGDVFDDVPFVKVKAGNSPDSEPNIVVERRRVCTLLYPCDMYNREGVLSRVQAVAIVREKQSGENFPENWDGSYNLFPYPDLAGSGSMWFADFRTSANVDRSYLRVDKRVASLSLLGWSYFRQRIGLNYTRNQIRLARLMEIGQPTWTELDLWQEWSAAKSTTDGFQKWYDAASPELAGFTPRAAADRQGMLLDVQQLMRSELQT
jgi:hypothetical protein